jgi:prepilin-type N-terminal cleavage/methylation domain-containing protein
VPILLFEFQSRGEKEVTMRRRTKRENGFSLIETLVVLSILLILFAMAMINVFNPMQRYKSQNSTDIVMSQLRQARQAAIANRRNVQVWVDMAFTGVDNIQHVNYQIITQPGDAPQPLQSIGIAKGTQFILLGTPDTPMGFGNGSAVTIGNVGGGGPPVMGFTSTGAFTDLAGTPLNGSIFIGVPGQAFTARAVTMMGGTGRVRSYQWTGIQWIE